MLYITIFIYINNKNLCACMRSINKMKLYFCKLHIIQFI